jgi:hypothetical protein
MAIMTNNAQLPEADSDGEPPKPFQVASYSDLLQFPPIPGTSKDTPSGSRDISTSVVDAIIVPTFRSAEQISGAVELASRARCQLIVLYTDNFPPGLSSVLAGLKEGEAMPLALRSRRDHHLIDLGADLPLGLASSAALDISRKRNLGLLIGRMLGWTRIILLDDDIRRLSIEKLSAAAALLDEYPVVGLKVTKFPDASVVGHARRLTGRRQEPFISGGSLLVDPQRLNGFFPAIYHEDWLCILNHLRLGEVAIGGRVGQLPYKPFTTPARARHEEFGDILASGLLWLVHDRNKASTADATAWVTDHDYWAEATEVPFWEQILEQRSALLENTAERFKAIKPLNMAALQSLQAALQRCNELTAYEFVSFTEQWVASLAVWRGRLSRLPQVDSVEKALAELGIRDIVRPYHAEPQPETAVSARQRHKNILAMGFAFVLGGLIGAAPSVLNRLWVRTRKSPLSRSHDGSSRLGYVKRGGGAGSGPEGPLAGGDQAEKEDDDAACRQ